jgi:peptide/nickel transport system ATP-binding protein
MTNEVKTELLSVEDLTLTVSRSGLNVVNGISFLVAPGEIVGAMRRSSGTIRFEGRDIHRLAPNELRKLRGGRIGMVFQEPMTSLNPSMLIGRQLDEGLALHRNLDAGARRRLIVDMLTRVGIADPEAALATYPHQFSGGMRQRIMLASVMLLRPALLVADEPTTALDAVVQRDVLELTVEPTRAHNTAGP